MIIYDILLKFNDLGERTKLALLTLYSIEYTGEIMKHSAYICKPA